MNRIIVCGGRDYDDRAFVYITLDRLYQKYGFDAVIQGGAKGADRLAYQWCIDRKVKCYNFPANWKTHGRAAGPIRNQQMIDEGHATHVVAFSGGKGTADMVRRAVDAGLQVWATTDILT